MAQTGSPSEKSRTGFQASRVIGSPAKPAQPTAAAAPARAPTTPSPPPAPTAQPAKPRRNFMQPTRPRIGMTSVFGFVLVFLCILGLVLNGVLPWLWVQPGAEVGGANPGDESDSETLNKGEMEDAFDRKATDYVGDLVSWPLLAFVFVLIAGVFLLLTDLVPMVVGVQGILQGVFLTVAGYFGFLLTLTGFRWLGMFIVEGFRPGDLQMALHVVPYVNLVLGLVILIGSVRLLKGLLAEATAGAGRGQFGAWAVRVPMWTSIVIAFSLLALPLLPFATQTFEGSDEPETYYGEADLANLKEVGSEQEKKPGEHLSTIRLMLWLTLYFSVASAFFGLMERTGRQQLTWGVLSQLYGLTLVPLAVGVIFTILLYTDIPKMGEDFVKYAPSLNWILLVTFLALAVLFFLYVTRVLVPFAKRVIEQNQRAAGATPSQ